MSTEWRPISSKNHNLEHRRCIEGGVEMFRNLKSGFSAVWNMLDHANGPLLGHLGWATVGRPPHFSLWNEEALNHEKQFYVKNPDAVELPPLRHEDWYDIKPDTSGTSGMRRSVVSIPLMHVIHGTTEQRKVAYSALHHWNTMQLMRPFSWYPWEFDPDGYTAWLICGDVRNAGRLAVVGPDGIKRNAWDTLHLETSPQFALAALGDDLGLMSMWMLWRWAADAYAPKQTAWMRTRSIGWRLIALTRATLLGLIPDPLSHTQANAQEHLWDCADQMIDLRERYEPAQPQLLASDLIALEEYKGELLGIKPWNHGLVCWAIRYAVSSGLLRDYQIGPLNNIAANMAAYLVERATPKPDLSVPWACGHTAFDWEVAREIQVLATEKHKKPLSAHRLPNGQYTLRQVASSIGEDEIYISLGMVSALNSPVVRGWARGYCDHFTRKDEKEHIIQPLRRMVE